MLQSDTFGQFNRDIQKYNEFIANGINHIGNELRNHLYEVSSEGRTFYNTNSYIETVIKGYVDFAHMLRSLPGLR